MARPSAEPDPLPPLTPSPTAEFKRDVKRQRKRGKDLAKLRAVDTGALGAAAQHLPGLYLALNTEDHAVSTDFVPVTH